MKKIGSEGNLFLGHSAIGLWLQSEDRSKRGWARFRNGDMRIANHYQDITEVVRDQSSGMLVARAGSAPSMAFPQTTQPGYTAISVSPSETIVDAEDREVMLLHWDKEWRDQCTVVAKAIGNELSGAVERNEFGPLLRLNIISMDARRYIPNSVCNELARSLTMSAGESSLPYSTTSTWDQPSKYKVRRSHISDWYRKCGTGFLLIGESSFGLWRWRTYKYEESEVETVRELRGSGLSAYKKFIEDRNLTQKIERLKSKGQGWRELVYELKEVDAGIGHVFVDLSHTLADNELTDEERRDLGVSLWQIGAGHCRASHGLT